MYRHSGACHTPACEIWESPKEFQSPTEGRAIHCSSHLPPLMEAKLQVQAAAQHEVYQFEVHCNSYTDTTSSCASMVMHGQPHFFKSCPTCFFSTALTSTPLPSTTTLLPLSLTAHLLPASPPPLPPLEFPVPPPFYPPSHPCPSLSLPYPPLPSLLQEPIH